MVGMNPRLSQEGITEELVTKAAEFWGRERADAIRPMLEEMGGYLWVVSQNLPDPEREPVFFL